MSERHLKTDSRHQSLRATRGFMIRVGLNQPLRFVIPDNALRRCVQHATRLRVSHGYSENALGRERQSDIPPLQETKRRLNHGEARRSSRMDYTG